MINILAYLSLAFIAFQLINTIINLVFSQNIVSKAKFKNSELISILIPARNEENNISEILLDLKSIDLQNIEFLIYNDHSLDKTEEIIIHFTETDSRFKLISSQNFPQGWGGKNHACYQLSKQAKGDYLLFLDADVRISKDAIQDTISYLKKNNLGFLSIFPTQIQKSFGEKISIPIMNYILLTLLPLVFVRISPFISHSAANGQFMLFKAEVYKIINPHLLFKNAIVEDISIARYLKKQNIKIACIIGDTRIQCRMYNNLKEALHGFSKNILMFFGNSFFIGLLFWSIITLGFIPIIIKLPHYFDLYLLIILLIQIIYALTAKQNIFYTLLLFPLSNIFLLITLGSAIVKKQKKNYKWKGRNIYS